MDEGSVGRDVESVDAAAFDEELDSMQAILGSLDQYEGLRDVIADPSRSDNLNEHFKQISEELRSLEQASLDDHLAQAADIVTLHQGLKECDGVLEQMEDVLRSFETDLRSVSQDIQALQIHSKRLTLNHVNRQAAHKEVFPVLEQLVVAPEAVRALLDPDARDDAYAAGLPVMDARMQYAHQLKEKGVVAALDITAESGYWCLKAVRKSREVLLKLIFGLRKPKTNLQILQSSVLLKYSYLNRFLAINAPATALEVRSHYIETVSRIFTSYFRIYVYNLSKLTYDIAAKNDLLGMAEDKKKAAFSHKQVHKNRASVFSLTNANVHAAARTVSPSASPPLYGLPSAQGPGGAGGTYAASPLLSNNRSTILQEVETTPAIIPHVAVQQGLKYPYEYAFHSSLRLLVDTACSEHLFDVEFFPKETLAGGDMFTAIFGKILVLVTDSLQTHLSSSYDCLGLLLMVGIARFNIDLLRVKRKIQIVPLEQYIGGLELHIWDRLTRLFESNLESLKIATSKTLGSVDTLRLGPHYVTRRYAEFAASVHTINTIITARLSAQGAPDQKIAAWMAPLRTSIERLLDKLVMDISDTRAQAVFLLNNYSHILNVLREHQPSPATFNNNDNDNTGAQNGQDPAVSRFNDDAMRFDYCFNVQVSVFIEEELNRYFSRLIAFVKTTDSQIAVATAAAVNTNNPSISDDRDNDAVAAPPSPPISSTSSTSSKDINININIDKDALDKLSSEFAANWRDVLEKIHHDVMNYFNDFELGSDVLKKVLSQFVLYYKRFEEIHRRCLRQHGSSQKAFIPTSTVTYEITKRYSSFA